MNRHSRPMRHTALLILSLLTFVTAAAQPKTILVTVTNSLQQERRDEPVIIRLNDLRKLRFNILDAAVTDGNREVPCQLDDLDSDGRNDELVWTTNLKAGEKKVFQVQLSAVAGSHNDRPRVYADMMLDDKKGKHPFITCLEAPGSSYLYSDLYHHGAAFESELTAYRIYFDHRQNIDIYGKQLRRLELADTHFYTTAEQQLQQYGNDVLWAGNSIGCGTLKLWDGTAPANWTDVNTRGQRIIASGPVRTIIEVSDIGTMLPSGHATADIHTRYTLYAGHREVRVDVQCTPAAIACQLVTGVQKVGASPASKYFSQGIVASWGTDHPEQSSAAMKEQFPPESVGLAVYVPGPFIANQKEDALNCLYILSPDVHGHIHYFVTFCADKEADGYHSANEWFNALPEWQQQMDHPAKVSFRLKKR